MCQCQAGEWFIVACFMRMLERLYYCNISELIFKNVVVSGKIGQILGAHYSYILFCKMFFFVDINVMTHISHRNVHILSNYFWEQVVIMSTKCIFLFEICIILCVKNLFSW